MKLNSLTGLRFVFAFMVFLCHLVYFYTEGPPELKYVQEHYFHYGYLGVNFFFILSGFVLAYTYFSKIAEEDFSVKDFMLKRVFRIVPLHYLTMLIVIPLVIQTATTHGVFDLHDAKQFTIRLVAHITLLQSFIPAIPYYFSFNNPSWSISAEMFFYILFPAIIAYILKKGLLKSYRNYLIGLVIVFILMTTIKNFHDLHWLFYINPVIRIFDFMFGIFIFCFYGVIKNSGIITATKASILQVTSVLLFAVFILCIEKVYHVYSYSLYFYVPMSLVVFSFAFEEGILSKLTASKPMVILGEASFSFYLTQDLVSRYMNWNGNRVQLVATYFNNNYVLYACLQLMLAIVVALIVHKVFEMPANNYLKRKYLSS